MKGNEMKLAIQHLWFRYRHPRDYATIQRRIAPETEALIDTLAIAGRLGVSLPEVIIALEEAIGRGEVARQWFGSAHRE